MGTPEDDRIDPQSIAEAVGAAARVQNYLGRNVEDQCAYCGQHFPPDENVIEKELYGRTWRFCSEECLADFREHSDFRDEDLDSPKEQGVTYDVRD